MKILILTKYPAMGPSSRYRFLQFIPALTKAGHRVRVHPFFSDRYLRGLFGGRRPNPGYLLGRCVARISHCLKGFRADMVWIEGELGPFWPAALEGVLHRILPRVRVYDFDDAIWLRYRDRSLLQRKFQKILAGAAGIVVGNAYLENYVKEINTHTLIVPTVVDWEKYRDASPKHRGHTVGWIGSPQTAFFLEQVYPALRELAEELPVKLRLVGASAAPEGLEVESVPWSLDTEIAEIERFDVGIMPLTADPWSRGKCGLKLVQYLAAGIPAVASPVGVNLRIITESGAGYLAEDRQAWVTSLRKLLESRNLRRGLGQNGRRWVQSEMTVEAQAPRLIPFLERCGDGA